MPSPTARALLASTALTTLVLTSPPARADNAIWHGLSPDYMDYMNWGPPYAPGSVYTVVGIGTAFFSSSFAHNVIISSPDYAVQAIDTFVIDRESYTFTFTEHASFQFEGTGVITVNGGSARFVNSGAVVFDQASSAGSTPITNTSSGVLGFLLSSTAGTAAITNQGGNASVVFYDNSRAGTATITNGAGGKVEFYLNATGDNATLTNQAGGAVRFWQNST